MELVDMIDLTKVDVLFLSASWQEREAQKM